MSALPDRIVLFEESVASRVIRPLPESTAHTLEQWAVLTQPHLMRRRKVCLAAAATALVVGTCGHSWLKQRNARQSYDGTFSAPQEVSTECWSEGRARLGVWAENDAT